MPDTVVAFVCVGNAGRSQMATGFAERERDRRGLDVDIVTGGTDPAERVHPETIEAMAEVGIALGDRTPRQIAPDDVEAADVVVTMGCSMEEFRPDGWSGDSREWDLEHPGGETIDAVRRQRDEIERRVSAFFDEFSANR